MPLLSMFYGIVVRMFWNDHLPPHFHAFYGGQEAQIGIETLSIIKGGLPRRAMTLTLVWAKQHRAELMEAWKQCEQKQIPSKIDPLP